MKPASRARARWPRAVSESSSHRSAVCVSGIFSPQTSGHPPPVAFREARLSAWSLDANVQKLRASKRHVVKDVGLKPHREVDVPRGGGEPTRGTYPSQRAGVSRLTPIIRSIGSTVRPPTGMWRVAAIATILLAGCGSDPAPQTAKTPPAAGTPVATVAVTATPVPIAKRMNAICKRWQPRADAFNARFRALANQGEYAAAAGQIRKGEVVQRRVDDQLAALEPPTGQAGSFRRYVGARRRLTALLADLADAVEAVDAGRAQEINDQIGRVRQARLDASLDLAADECR